MYFTFLFNLLAVIKIDREGERRRETDREGEADREMKRERERARGEANESLTLDIQFKRL